MPWDFWLIFLALGLFFPWRGHVKFQRLLATPSIGKPERIALYLSTIAFQWIAAAIVAWRVFTRGLSLAELGLSLRNDGVLVVTSIGGGVLLGVLHWLNLRRLAKRIEGRGSQLRAVAERILPHSNAELIPYAGLALTAGICEEFLYRGFAMAALFRAGLPDWSVVILSAVLFGMAHLYQGRSGFAGTLLLGLVFGSVRILCDSIVPLMLWHAAVDVVAGAAGAKYFAGPSMAGEQNGSSSQ